MSNRKLILYIAASLDGYIATEDHNLDWLFSVDGDGDNGFSNFYETVDTFLIGRTTYDWIMKQENGNFPYKNKECYVFSRTYKNDNEFVKFINDDIISFVSTLKNKDGKDIWVVGGGELIHDLINEGLIDEFRITIAPVLIGKGIKLFKSNNIQTSLNLINITQYNQLVELHYVTIKEV